VIAYKFLNAAGRGRFSEACWPLPVDGGPGAWLSASLPLLPCVRGVHALLPQQLPFWLDQQLWEIELDGQIIERDSMLVAQRGRLLRRIEGWSQAGWEALCEFVRQRSEMHIARVAQECSEQLERARFYMQEVDAFIGLGAYPTAVYVAAVAAHVGSALAPEAAYRAERAQQAHFLSGYLQLGH
jgi:hypothetical protein